MKITQSSIFLREMHFYAYHGVFPQERTVGGEYMVSLKVNVDITAAVTHDLVDVALNYATLYDIVKKEMEQPSDLLEHVAARIGESVFRTFPQVKSLDVQVTKLNPPMGADCRGAGVELQIMNDKHEA